MEEEKPNNEMHESSYGLEYLASDIPGTTVSSADIGSINYEGRFYLEYE